MNRLLSSIFAFTLLTCAARLHAESASYDPLKVPPNFDPETVDLTVHDAARQRDIPIRLFMPQKTDKPAPVVLFSHGLGGSRTGYQFLGQQWARRGYLAVYVQHPGSDDSVWKNVPPAQRGAAMRQAANTQNFLLRVKDIPAVLDQLKLWNEESGHEVEHRMDLSHLGMSGHSFGAVTTQGVSGESFPLGNDAYTDPRIKAAIAMSPSAPSGNMSPQAAFAAVKIPWMLMTGTKDNAPIGHSDVKSRLLVYPALPPGDKYELVLNNAEHSAFSDTPLPGDKEPRNPNHHRAILALSTAFWDVYLKNDPDAKAWLNDSGPKGILEKDDAWQHK